MRAKALLIVSTACVVAGFLMGCQSSPREIIEPQASALPPEGRFGHSGVDNQTRTAFPSDEGVIRLTDTDELLYVFDGATGEPLTGRQVAQAMHSAEVVILGEMHTDPMAHRLQQRFVREALWEDGALSIEMMSRDEQAALARAQTAPAAAEAELAATSLVGWPRWNQFYLPTIREAITMGRPVIAANAPRGLVREARLYGYDYLRELPPQQQRLFDVPADVDAYPEYRERVTAVVAGHQMTTQPAQPQPPSAEPATRPQRERLDAHVPQDSSAQPAATQQGTDGIAQEVPAGGRTWQERPANDPDAFFEAQLLWDATMANSIMSARKHGRPVVHLVGSFHSDYSGGLTEMLRRRGQRVVTVSFVPGDAQQLQLEDFRRADIVIYTGADRPLPPEKPATSRPARQRPATQPDEELVAGEDQQDDAAETNE